jgi:hypothetical protein
MRATESALNGFSGAAKTTVHPKFKRLNNPANSLPSYSRPSELLTD